MSRPILSLVTFVPLVGALSSWRCAAGDAVKRNARWIALVTTCRPSPCRCCLVASSTAHGRLPVRREATTGSRRHRLPHGRRRHLDAVRAADRRLMPSASSPAGTRSRRASLEYMIAFLVLETLMIGVFCALDLVLFYLFFEGGLIPMFLIIGIWGGKRRVYASFKFFLYTLLGSVLMLLAIMAMYWTRRHDRHPELLTYHFPPAMQTWLWLAFFASFAVKMPMWPVHTWLPDAHVEAPTAGSVILAGILLKMGGYGFLRFSLPMFPDASQQFAPLVFALSVVAIIYTSLVALAQEDMKKLIAYSSVAHMGFVTMGIFTGNAQGVAGRHLPDAAPRGGLGRAVPLRRRGLRPHAHPRDRRLWRAGRTACRCMPRPSWCSPWPMSACRAPRASSASS